MNGTDSISPGTILTWILGRFVFTQQRILSIARRPGLTQGNSECGWVTTDELLYAEGNR
jgi:hypothetical protein